MLKSARKQSSASKQSKDPEGRMPLVEHLRELRNRMVKSLLAVLPLMVLALFFAKDIIEFVTDPVPQCTSELEAAAQEGRCAVLSQVGLTSPFTTFIKVSLITALVGAAPVWLYQMWAFLAPGLHNKEKKYALSTVAFGTPLFLTGAYLAYWVLPHAVPVLLSFSIDGSTNYITADDMIDISVKLTLAFGLAFQLPLILTLLNLGGVLSGRRMLSWWRGMVLGISIFAALVTPTDPLSMLVLALPIIGLYFAATAFALFNDRRKAKADPDTDLDDDEASDIDLTPSTIGGVSEVEGDDGRHGNANGTDRHRGGLDDAT
ncbi:twin-arginine translocase subunit TatC [Streptomyces sp. P38-E01]|uniref:Sec-independent protein translocase protein TatC n=1 Tax=Streptomyces tardus TaxID=2780544 RepID=A0A949JH31_9ACTN|nr:twin-arginine translocase subunit TatC [Streptomyces tardus]MBU7599882.1 twin-arginine translocase subunit TatC [Streptomyces tardus]